MKPLCFLVLLLLIPATALSQDYLGTAAIQLSNVPTFNDPVNVTFSFEPDLVFSDDVNISGFVRVLPNNPLSDAYDLPILNELNIQPSFKFTRPFTFNRKNTTGYMVFLTLTSGERSMTSKLSVDAPVPEETVSEKKEPDKPASSNELNYTLAAIVLITLLVLLRKREARLLRK